MRSRELKTPTQLPAIGQCKISDVEKKGEKKKKIRDEEKFTFSVYKEKADAIESH